MLKRRGVSGWKLLAVLLCIIMMAAGCGNNNGNSGGVNGNQQPQPDQTEGEAPGADLKPVQLTWYYAQPSIPADLKEVEAAANKIIKAKINATVKLMPVIFGDYTQKMNTVAASGESADIVWTSNWNFDYVQNQSKGAFLPLDELLDQYAPALASSMPEFVWNATKIDGQIFAVPNYQTVTNQEGFIVQKRFLDKYKWDLSTLRTMKDIEPILAQLKMDEPESFPWAMDRKGAFGNMQRLNGLEPIVNNMVAIDLSNPNQAVAVYRTPQYKEYLALIHSFYKKGYINQDASTLKSLTDIQKRGDAYIGFHNVLKPGGEAESKVQNGGQDVVYAKMTDVYAGTNTIITTMNAISRNSNNPERAMMLINLVNTDKELYNLLVYGLEGKHHKVNSDGTVAIVKDGGYAAADWALGSVFNGKTLEGKDPAVAEQTRKENESAKPSPIMGFKFKADAVTAEIANVNSLIDEYTPGLDTGTINPDDKLPEFLDKLDKAGLDKIVAEVQRQLDEWRKTK
ncbi:ABC transporter substrate-binding protein [Paenibacillus sp. GCM10023252]|uniref:ABC transporter substrate-binding protein n=1 Tax=Paenibacillus sp. GCM10023252 TaxID=3252649 RepID=UPI0036077F0E